MNKLRLSPDLALPEDAVTQTFAILAKRGAGKTYTGLVLVEELLGAGAQVVVVDPVGVCWGLRAAANGKDPGLPIVVMGGDHGDVPLEATAGKVVAEFVVDTRSSVVLDLALLRKGDQVRFMTDFAETLYHRNRAPLHLLLDEADAFAPQRPLHGQERMLGAVQDLVRRGRARGIGVTLVTQRAAVLSKDVLTQVEVLVALRTIAPQDREAIDAWIQAHDAHGQRAEFMASLASLPIGTAWFWSPGWLDLFKRVRIRPRTTFDSSATPKVGARPPAPKQLAPVDLDQLTQRIAATIERAKQEDPRALRTRIAELECELQTSARRRAQAPTEQRVEVPVLKEAHVKRLEAVFHGAEKLSERTREALAAMVTVATEALEAMRAHATAPPVGARTALIRAQRASGTRERILARPTAVMVSRRSASDDSGLGAGERKMLEALALRHPDPLSKAQLGLLAGYAASGGTFRTYLPRLHRAALVEVRDDRVTLTSTGRAAVGEFRHAPQTPEQVRSIWLSALDQGPRRMLEVLVTAYPKSLTKAELGEASGYEAAGGTFRTYLPKLKRLGLVDVDRDQVRASEMLFS
jgi:Helicase HerA, central domain/Helicase HerA-like C-terminal